MPHGSKISISWLCGLLGLQIVDEEVPDDIGNCLERHKKASNIDDYVASIRGAFAMRRPKSLD